MDTDKRLTVASLATMHRTDFLKDLEDYESSWAAGRAAYPGLSLAEERAALAGLRKFITETPACFERTWTPGHVTGSALVASPDLTHVLLTLHGKLNKWLQLGGHADGHHLPHEVAMREAEEESGLGQITHFDWETRFLGRKAGGRPLPFDLDTHLIPARKSEAEHYHYDVRYLIVGDPRQPFLISDESQDLRWFEIAEARKVTDERSMHRQFDKLLWLRANLA